VSEAVTKDRLRELVTKLILLTKQGDLHWAKQINSAHRYARWNNHLLILGPNTPLSESSEPRYLFVTPFDSPSCIEVSSSDEELGSAVLELVAAVEVATSDEPATDPFAVTADFLSRLTD
jgi:hypothetical protein